MSRSAEDWRKLAVDTFEMGEEEMRNGFNLFATESYTKAAAAAAIATALSRAIVREQPLRANSKGHR